MPQQFFQNDYVRDYAPVANAVGNIGNSITSGMDLRNRVEGEERLRSARAQGETFNKEAYEFVSSYWDKAGLPEYKKFFRAPLVGESPDDYQKGLQENFVPVIEDLSAKGVTPEELRKIMVEVGFKNPKILGDYVGKILAAQVAGSGGMAGGNVPAPITGSPIAPPGSSTPPVPPAGGDNWEWPVGGDEGATPSGGGVSTPAAVAPIVSAGANQATSVNAPTPSATPTPTPSATPPLSKARQGIQKSFDYMVSGNEDVKRAISSVAEQDLAPIIATPGQTREGVVRSGMTAQVPIGVTAEASKMLPSEGEIATSGINAYEAETDRMRVKADAENKRRLAGIQAAEAAAKKSEKKADVVFNNAVDQEKAAMEELAKFENMALATKQAEASAYKAMPMAGDDVKQEWESKKAKAQEKIDAAKIKLNTAREMVAEIASTGETEERRAFMGAAGLTVADMADKAAYPVLSEASRLEGLPWVPSSIKPSNQSKAYNRKIEEAIVRTLDEKKLVGAERKAAEKILREKAYPKVGDVGGKTRSNVMSQNASIPSGAANSTTATVAQDDTQIEAYLRQVYGPNYEVALSQVGNDLYRLYNDTKTELGQ